MEVANEVNKLGTGFAVHESIIHMVKEFNRCKSKDLTEIQQS